MYNKFIQNKALRAVGVKIQNFIGTDLRYLAKNGSLLFLGQVIVSIATLGLTWVLANYVDKELVGQYRFIISIQAVLSIIALSGMNTALSKSVAEGYDSSLGVAFRKKMQFGLYAGIASMLIGVCYLFADQETSLFWGFVALAVGFPLYEAGATVFSYLQGKKDFYKQSLYSTIVRVITIAITVVVCLMGANLAMLILVNFLVGGLLQLYIYRSVKKSFVQINSVEKIDPTFFSLSVHFTIMGVLFSVVSQLDRFILFQFFGAATLATYWIATTLPLEMQRMFNIIGSLSFPKFVGREKAVIQKTLPRKIFLATGVLTVVSICYIALAPSIFGIFFPQYVDSVGLSQVFALTTIFMPHLFIWQYFAAAGNKKILYVYHIADPVLQILLYIVLIPFLGVWGIVYATIGKNACLYIAGLLTLSKT